MKYYNFHWEYYRHMAAWEPGKNTNNFVMITLSTVWGPFYNSYQLFVSRQPAHQLATVWSLYLHGWLPSKSQSDNELTCLVLTEAHWWNINLCLPLSLKSYFGAFMMSELRAHSCLIAASCLPPATQPPTCFCHKHHLGMASSYWLLLGDLGDQPSPPPLVARV